MNTYPVSADHAPRFLRRALSALLFTGLACLVAAQSPGTGSISGRVQNEATGQYLNNARITVKGTDLASSRMKRARSGFRGVPGRRRHVRHFIPASIPQEVTVNVSPGQSVERDINLTNTRGLR